MVLPVNYHQIAIPVFAIRSLTVLAVNFSVSLTMTGVDISSPQAWTALQTRTVKLNSPKTPRHIHTQTDTHTHINIYTGIHV